MGGGSGGSRGVAARALQALEVPLLLAVPLVMVWSLLAGASQAAGLMMLVVALVIAFFFAGYEASRPGLRQIMPTLVLAALAAAGRIVFGPIPDFKPVSAIAIIAGATLGRRNGFMVGALAALTSNFFFGQGMWTPWQMYAWGLVGYLGGVLADAGAFERRVQAGREGRAAAGDISGAARRDAMGGGGPMRAGGSAPAESRVRRVPLLAYGFASGLIYGAIINAYDVIGFVQPLTWAGALARVASAAPFDLMHGGATVVFLAALYQPWTRKISRIVQKYDLRA